MKWGGLGIAVTCVSLLTLSQARKAETVSSRMKQFGPSVDARLMPAFRKAGVKYPPYKLGILAFKQSKKMEIYAKSSEKDAYKLITQYEILGASGKLGPKLKEGDLQVPEGIYRAESLNPNSKFHLSIRLNYPNAFDRKMAKLDNRKGLGGDIMIHGKTGSIGCLAMGDLVAEELFVLCERTGLKNVKVIISPSDFRPRGSFVMPLQPAWLDQLYAEIRKALREFN